MERESMHLQKLRDGRYVVVNKHEGEIKVHVRICNKVDSGELVPTKKGICMGSKRFASFLLHEPNVAKFVQSIQDDDESSVRKFKPVHIGGGIYISINREYDIVDMRRFFVPEDKRQPIPTRSGVCVKVNQWVELVSALRDVHVKFNELSEATPCYLDDDHSNQLALKQCKECTPFPDVML